MPETVFAEDVQRKTTTLRAAPLGRNDPARVLKHPATTWSAPSEHMAAVQESP